MVSAPLTVSTFHRTAKKPPQRAVHLFRKKRNDPWLSHLSFQMPFKQPRVISVHSYYLTSLVTSLSADSFLTRSFLLCNIPSHLPSNYHLTYSHLREAAVPEGFRWKRLVLGGSVLIVAFFDSQQVPSFTFFFIF